MSQFCLFSLWYFLFLRYLGKPLTLPCSIHHSNHSFVSCWTARSCSRFSNIKALQSLFSLDYSCSLPIFYNLPPLHPWRPSPLHLGAFFTRSSLSIFWARFPLFLPQQSLLLSVLSPYINIPQLLLLPVKRVTLQSSAASGLSLIFPTHLLLWVNMTHPSILPCHFVIILPPEHFSFSSPLLPSFIVYLSVIGSAFSPHLMADTLISLKPNLSLSSSIWCPLHTPAALYCSTLCLAPKHCTSKCALFDGAIQKPPGWISSHKSLHPPLLWERNSVYENWLQKSPLIQPGSH